MPITKSLQIIESNIASIRDDLEQTRFLYEMLITDNEMLRQRLAEAQAVIEQLTGKRTLTPEEIERGRRAWDEMEAERKSRGRRGG